MMLSSLSRGYTDPDGEDLVALADKYIDEALDVLSDEEPRLMSWLMHDSEVDRALRATMAGVFGVVAKDARRGAPFEHSLRAIQHIMFRFTCVTALNAVMQERSSTQPEDLFDGTR